MIDLRREITRLQEEIVQLRAALADLAYRHHLRCCDSCAEGEAALRAEGFLP